MVKPDHTTLFKRLRLGAFALGALFFLWLPLEDSSLTWVLAISISITVILTAFFLFRPSRRVVIDWKTSLFAGILAGLAVTPLGFLLMAIKTGLHGHLEPDFSAHQMSLLWRSTPIWILSGLLIGSGLAVLARGRQNA